ncbi:MAG: hypothetical protein L0Y75_01090 [Acidobacteria bacterium]|nr:hypothetical protein [Acidobacteriota bacterium]
MKFDKGQNNFGLRDWNENGSKKGKKGKKGKKSFFVSFVLLALFASSLALFNPHSAYIFAATWCKSWPDLVIKAAPV